MKNKLFYILMLFCFACPIFSQECVLCGDWVGTATFKDVMDGSKQTIKRTVRIKQEEGTYSIKMKTLRNGEDVEYYNSAQIKHADENLISWFYLDFTDSDWDSSDKINGVIIESADYYVHCKVELITGVLKYTQYWIAVYYNRYGQYIGEKRFGDNSVYDCVLNKVEEW